MKQTTAQQKFHYFDIRQYSSEHVLELTSLNDFQRFASLHQIRSIFRLLSQDAAGEPEFSHFAVSHKGGLLQQAAQGFKTLEDVSAAQAAGFPDAAAYYAACSSGYKTFADYELAQQAGISDKELFKQIKDGGFVDGLEEYNRLISDPALSLPDIGLISNPRELYEYAQQHHFESFAELLAALQEGFADAQEKSVANERGFSNAAQYQNAASRDFHNYADYALAEEKGFRDMRDGLRYMEVENVAAPGCLHDQKLLLSLLSRLEQGKRVGVNKIRTHFRTMLDEFRYADTGELPAWFSRAFAGEEEVDQFLKTNDQVKRYGHYDEEGEYFEVNCIQDRKVIIDGSNVAHNSRNGKPGNSAPALMSNVCRLVDFLKGKGFEMIAVVADASLKHRVPDKENIEKLKAEIEYLEAPAEKPADVFLLSYVKANHCLLVSNDTFREWKLADPWVASNIDYYRLSFLIKDDAVLMPDLGI